VVLVIVLRLKSSRAQIRRGFHIGSRVAWVLGVTLSPTPIFSSVNRIVGLIFMISVMTASSLH
jgi:hypothetical protein